MFRRKRKNISFEEMRKHVQGHIDREETASKLLVVSDIEPYIMLYTQDFIHDNSSTSNGTCIFVQSGSRVRMHVVGNLSYNK